MKKSAQLLIIVTGMIWGSMGILIRVLGGIGLESLDMIAVRAMIITVTLFLYLLIFRRDELKIKVKDLWCFIGTGLISVVWYNYCYYETIKQSSLAVATIWLYTAPAFVMLFSAFLFKEKLTVNKLISIVATFIGCVCVSGIVDFNVTHDITNRSILLGLGAGIGYALYSIFSRYAINKGYSTITIMFYTFLIVAISTIGMINVQTVVQTAFGNIYHMGMCFLLAIGGTLIPYFLYMKGMLYVENSTAAILVSVEPITATLLGLLVYKENLNTIVWIGVVMVLGGILISAKE